MVKEKKTMLQNSDIEQMEKQAEGFEDETTRQLSQDVLAKLRIWREEVAVNH